MRKSLLGVAVCLALLAGSLEFAENALCAENEKEGAPVEENLAGIEVSLTEDTGEINEFFLDYYEAFSKNDVDAIQKFLVKKEEDSVPEKKYTSVEGYDVLHVYSITDEQDEVLICYVECDQEIKGASFPLPVLNRYFITKTDEGLRILTHPDQDIVQYANSLEASGDVQTLIETVRNGQKFVIERDKVLNSYILYKFGCSEVKEVSVSGANLNLREKPVDGNVVGKCMEGTILHELAVLENGWAVIAYEGEILFAASNYLKEGETVREDTPPENTLYVSDCITETNAGPTVFSSDTPGQSSSAGSDNSGSNSDSEDQGDKKRKADKKNETEAGESEDEEIGKIPIIIDKPIEPGSENEESSEKESDSQDNSGERSSEGSGDNPEKGSEGSVDNSGEGSSEGSVDNPGDGSSEGSADNSGEGSGSSDNNSDASASGDGEASGETQIDIETTIIDSSDVNAYYSSDDTGYVDYSTADYSYDDYSYDDNSYDDYSYSDDSSGDWSSDDSGYEEPSAE